MNAAGEPVDLGIPGLADAVEVGRGGFAVVYRCHQERFGRTVAVKVLRDAINDETARVRFQRECLAMGMLSGHPNIVTVYEAGFRGAGDPYIVMDFMRGGSLADELVARGPLPWQEVVHDAVMLLGALHSAHAAGVLHRDIKPENVMRSTYGGVKLTDFGIARLRHGPQTRTEGLTASIPHVAPELIAGGPATVQSDLYAVGSTMFHLLAGSPAFLRDTDESILPALARIAADPVPDLRGSGIPEEVCRVIEQLMDKEPHDRPGSARSVAEQLQNLQRSAGLPVTQLAIADVDPAQSGAGALGTSPPTPAPVAPLPPPPPAPSRPPATTPASKGSAWRIVGWLGGVLAVAALAAASIVLSRSGAPGPAPQAQVSAEPAASEGASGSTPAPAANGSTAGTGSPPDAPLEPLLPEGGVRAGVPPADPDPPASFDTSFATDGHPETAWAVSGDGVGTTLTLDFGRPVRIRSIGIIPGESRVDPEGERTDHYRRSRRIARARYIFEQADATEVRFTGSADWDMEVVEVDLVTASLTIEILESTPGRDRVAISEVEVLGTADPGLPAGTLEALPDGGLDAEPRPPAPPPPPDEVTTRYVFPVYPPARTSYSRGHNEYPGLDIYAPCGTPVVAPTAGRVDEVQRTDEWQPRRDLGATRGGIFVTFVGDDGVRYLFSRLSEVAAGLEPRDTVVPGQLLGAVGRSGRGDDTLCHTHMGLSRPGSGPQDWRPRRGEIDPYPYVQAWRNGRDRSPRGELQRLRG